MKKVLLMATIFISLVAVACSSGKDERNHRERHHKKSLVINETDVARIVV